MSDTETTTERLQITSGERAFRLARASMYKVRGADWLVPGFVERDALHLLYGASGSLKSFLLILWLLEIWKATGQPVVAIIGEGLRGFVARVHAAAIASHIDPDEIPFFISSRATFLNSTDTVGDVIASLAEIEADYGPPAAIGIDTLARNAVGANENSTEEAGQIIGGLDEIRRAYHSAIIVVHHTGWGDTSRIRGSSALLGAADFAHHIEKDNTGVARLRCAKSKDSEEPDPRAYRLATVELPFTDDTGNTIESAVIREIEYTEPRGKSGNTGRGKWQQKAYSVLEQLQGKAVDNLRNAGMDPSDARVEIKTWRVECLESGIPKQRFYDAKNTLAETGEITLGGGYVST